MNVRVLQTNEPSRFSGIPESDEILMLYGRELPFLMFLACVVIFFLKGICYGQLNFLLSINVNELFFWYQIQRINTPKGPVPLQNKQTNKQKTHKTRN